VGKASNRKALRRQGIGPSRQDVERKRTAVQLLRGMEGVRAMMAAKEEHDEATRRLWRGYQAPDFAEVPRWREDSLGDRCFYGLRSYARAPRLASATVPAGTGFAADSAHWGVAISALIRAVTLDQVPLSDPVVSEVLALLGPVAEAEAEFDRAWTEGTPPEEDFPELDAPLSTLGASVLIDVTWAVIGLDPIESVMGVLEPHLDAALAGLDCAHGLTGQVLTRALIRAFADHHVLEEPGDVETLQRLGGKSEGNPLTVLIRDKAMTPTDALTIGLTVLTALTDLCRTDASSVLARDSEARLPGSSAHAGPPVHRAARPPRCLPSATLPPKWFENVPVYPGRCNHLGGNVVLCIGVLGIHMPFFGQQDGIHGVLRGARLSFAVWP